MRSFIWYSQSNCFGIHVVNFYFFIPEIISLICKKKTMLELESKVSRVKISPQFTQGIF